MKVGYSVSRTLALTAALSLGVGIASAQTADTTKKPVVKPTSETRIPVRKESKGEVIDTTTKTPLPAPPVVVVTPPPPVVEVTPLPPEPEPLPPLLVRKPSGLYFGIGAGSSIPLGTGTVDFATLFTPMYQTTAILGYDPVDSWFGVRGDLGYSRFDPRKSLVNEADEPRYWTASLDAKARYRMSGDSKYRPTVYAIGGATFNKFRNVLVGALLANGTRPTGNGWDSTWGYNAGAGVSFGLGRTDLFLESRFIKSELIDQNRNHIPITLGVSFF